MKTNVRTKFRRNVFVERFDPAVLVSSGGPVEGSHCPSVSSLLLCCDVYNSRTNVMDKQD